MRLARRIISHSKPFALLIETRNSSVHILEDELNYTSLTRFMRNHVLNLNKRYARSETSKNLSINRNQHIKNIIDVNASRVVSVFDVENANDLLVFYYNNWCGFCKSLHFNLMLLMHKYFSGVNTFKLLRINVQENDLPGHLFMQHIPALLLIPANSSLKESVLYEYQHELDMKHLQNFILVNSRNPNTVKDFITSNFLNSSKYHHQQQLSKQSKLRYDLIDLVEKKLFALEAKAHELVKKHSAYSMSGHLNESYLTGESVKFSILNNDEDYEKHYFSHVKSLFNLKLNMYEQEIDLLKEFRNLFNKNFT